MSERSQKLYVHESGDHDKPVIIFLHGSPLSGRMWQPQLEDLTEFHCLAPDLPGHGQSTSLPLNMPDIVQRLSSLVADSSPNGKAHIVGLSFGGVVAQALMVAHPDLVDHAILSGTAARMSKLLVWMSMLNEPILRMLNPKQLAAIVCWQFGIPAKFRDQLSDDFKAFSSKTLANVMKTYLDIEIPMKTKSPTLVAVGQKETIYAKSAARLLNRSIPGSNGVVVPNCGHVWNLEAPDLFNATVRAWITGRELPDGLLPLIGG
jgi:pimeloyl-ACP methyl ester carboxylesterase